MKCSCGQNIFETRDNKVKVRTNIIIFEKGTDGESIALIKCPKCKRDLKVPILLDIDDQNVKHLIFEK